MPANHVIKKDEIIHRVTDSVVSAVVSSQSCLDEIEKADLPFLKKIVIDGNADAPNCVSFSELIKNQRR